MRKRKSSGLFLIAAVLAAAGCGSQLSNERVRLNIPGKPELPAKDAPEIILSGFWAETAVKNLDLEAEITSFWRNALKREFKGRISEKAVAWNNGELPASPAVWVETGRGSPGALILTGKASFSTETRKALVSSASGKFEGPWDPPNPWAENRNFALKLEIIILKADDGSVAFRREFQESLNTENKKPTPVYALHDLLDRIAPRLLISLFGSPRSLERYLLMR